MKNILCQHTNVRNLLKQISCVDGVKTGRMRFSHGGWNGMRAIQKNLVYSIKTRPFKAAVNYIDKDFMNAAKLTARLEPTVANVMI